MKTLHLAGPPYQHGATALQGALIERGLLPHGSADDQYGPATARAVEKAKWSLGYPASLIHHGHEIAGDLFLAYLTGRKPLPAAYKGRQAHRRTHLPPEDHDADARARIVREYEALIDASALIDYAQVRPIPHARGPITSRYRTDCSGSITWACERAGVPDPNGLRYNGQGYTGTLMAHLARIQRRDVKPGDLVVWLPPQTGHHVAVFLDPEANVLGNFGSDPGPKRIGFQDENAAQARLGHPNAVYLRLRTS